MSGDLPPGWALVTPDQISAHVSNALTIGPFGSDLKVSDYRTNGVPLVFVREIRAGLFGDKKTKCVDQAKAAQLARHTVRAGDLLVTKMGDPPGDTAVYPDTRPDAIITADCIKLTPNMLLTSSAYLNLCFKSESVRGEVLENTAGVAQQKLSLERFRTVRLPLPPLNEQRRIVAKLEDLLARSRRAKDALDAIPPLLEKLRQSILAAAFRGDLTADWRAKNPNVEPAEELLKRIRIERRKKWEEAELAKLRAKGKPPTDDRWKAKYKEPEPVDASELPQLPEGWCWASLREVLELKGGITKGQRRSPSAITRVVPYLRVANVQRGYLDLREVTTIEAEENEIEELALKAGDILFNEGGDRDKLGRGWVWSGELPLCIHQNHVFRGRPVSNALNSELVSWFANSQGQEYFLRAGAQTTNLASINLTKLGELSIPLAPVDEQELLRSRIGAALTVADRLARQSRQSIERTVELNERLLAKAFRGELVDQDPNDEPASVMLERLAAERQAAQETPATPKRSSRQKARA